MRLKSQRNCISLEENIMNLFNRKRIHIDYGNFNIFSLMSMLKDGLDLSPDYQRGDEWNIEDQQAFIKSIFKGYEIGRVVIREIHTLDCIGEVVDGKQRITAIRDFIEGKFSIQGFYYEDLDEDDNRMFMDSKLSLGFIREDVPYKDILGIFIEINSRGRVVSKEHIEKVRSQLEDLK